MNTVLNAAGLSWTDPETGEQRISGNPQVIRLKLLPNLTEETGSTVVDEDGNESPEMAPVPGYHVNVLVHQDQESDYRAALSAVLLDPEPKKPLVRWMGC
jgi:hypothetical protein